MTRDEAKQTIIGVVMAYRGATIQEFEVIKEALNMLCTDPEVEEVKVEVVEGEVEGEPVEDKPELEVVPNAAS